MNFHFVLFCERHKRIKIAVVLTVRFCYFRAVFIIFRPLVEGKPTERYLNDDRIDDQLFIQGKRIGQQDAFAVK